jgi:hypothetical protein
MIIIPGPPGPKDMPGGCADAFLQVKNSTVVTSAMEKATA